MTTGRINQGAVLIHRNVALERASERACDRANNLIIDRSIESKESESIVKRRTVKSFLSVVKSIKSTNDLRYDNANRSSIYAPGGIRLETTKTEIQTIDNNDDNDQDKNDDDIAAAGACYYCCCS